MVEGTPVKKNSVSTCAHFLVNQTSSDTFKIKYTAISHRNNQPVTFIVDGTVSDDILAQWQLVGYKEAFGPFKHVILSPNYDSSLAMIVCGNGNPRFIPRGEIAMIWSRQKTLPEAELNDLKTKLGEYIDKETLLPVNNINC
ncbi:uncharacterized protein LOC105696339 [Orussus abietinus]|uniref:uncharacterized protein LOC105696339 n=1 Tax=Orussus abietinus TaxID=222816 RepID=UPI000C715DAB|nr:uncharacterized protein LOC105696339 [Orussus abietinus]